MLNWWGKYRETLLGCGALVALLLLVLVKVKLTVPDYMRGPEWNVWVAFFQSKAFEDIAGDLLTGFVAAYFFYVLIDLLPRRSREHKTKEILSTLLSSIVETFLHENITAYAEPLSGFHPLKIEEIKGCRELLEGDPNGRNFLSLAFIANWSYPRFSNSLQLASSLGTDHAAIWMDVTDCLSRLKYHSDKANESGLIRKLVGVKELDGESMAWCHKMSKNMKEFLGLTEQWHELNHVIR